MELNEIMRTNGTCRYYTSEVVSDEVLAPVLDAARWAPTGGNRQPLRLIAVRDVAAKRRLKALYLPIWNSYVKGIEAGETRVQARPKLLEDADHFANHMDEIPIMLVVCARLADVHPTDTELGRLSIVGGASVYPAIENILLAAREAGLGTALTTLLCAVEAEVKVLLRVPDDI
ncbi:MAG TPA: nitroreductase family protein, partial [Gammaproteobacteria bacterium]|nr:nitroreductase family protein [Gammaproteobacteria bacterium]